VRAAFHAELPVVLRTVSGASAAQKLARPFLDLLAEARLHAETGSGRKDALDSAIATLRHRRQGDTLIYLTGPGGAKDIGRVGTLRGAYPSIVVATIGTTDDESSTVDGLLVLAAGDGLDFARAWDGVREW